MYLPSSSVSKCWYLAGAPFEDGRDKTTEFSQHRDIEPSTLYWGRWHGKDGITGRALYARRGWSIGLRHVGRRGVQGMGRRGKGCACVHPDVVLHSVREQTEQKEGGKVERREEGSASAASDVLHSVCRLSTAPLNL
eukprot:2417079-Rhodomonas_salina.2